MGLISIHAPARGATGCAPSRFQPSSHFNSRPCERGDDLRRRQTVRERKFQFTPLREGRRSRRAAKEDTQRISIHAPARGATHSADIQDGVIVQFQFTPLREGRPQGACLVLILLVFQFTPLREGRLIHTAIFILQSNISIHAPARGATTVFRSNPDRKQISIHAPARGATWKPALVICCNRFQFTPLREGRLPRATIEARLKNFNSRPCERGDAHIAKLQARKRYFNSRPCERGDLLQGLKWEKIAFQFTPLREGRRNVPDSELGTTVISIHAPARGATAKSNKICSVFSAIIEKNS